MHLIMDAIRNIRNIRAEMNVPPSRKAKMIFVATGSDEKLTLLDGKSFFERMAGASEAARHE